MFSLSSTQLRKVKLFFSFKGGARVSFGLLNDLADLNKWSQARP